MAGPGSGSYDAFLSYAHEDREVARAVRSALEERAVEVFVDELIEPGQDWVGVLESTIASGAAFLALVSEAALRSHWVKRETHYIQTIERGGQPVTPYPLWLSGKLPGFLSLHQAVDLSCGVGTDEFDSQMASLATAIHKQKPARLAATVLDDLGFLAFFPQGLPQPVFRSLIDARGLKTAVATATGRRAIVEREVDGAPLVGLSLPVLPWVEKAVADSDTSLREVIEQVEAALRDSDPYGGSGPPAPGLTLLLRDELRLVGRHEATREDVDEAWLDLRDEIVWRARDAWPRLLSEEGRLAVALEIMAAQHALEPPDLREGLTRAQLNLRLGAPDRALDMFDSLAGSELFDDGRLTPAERIATFQDWAKAAKDAGEGRARHGDLLRAYQEALDLVGEAYPDGRERELVRADLLANRATQLTVFGDGRNDLERADADLGAAAEVYRRLGESAYLLELEAERLSLALHRLPEQAVPPESLRQQVARVQKLADDAEATYGLFFFYYMKGTILDLAGERDEALQSFETAERVAEHQRLDSPATLARWKVLRLQLATERIDKERFLAQIDLCKQRLLEHRGDAWSTNALSKLLIEDVKRVALELDRWDEAIDAAVAAFDLAVRRAAGRSATALGRVRRMRDQLLELAPDDDWGRRFVDARKDTLAQLLGISPWKVGWDEIKVWQPKGGE